MIMTRNPISDDQLVHLGYKRKLIASQTVDSSRQTGSLKSLSDSPGLLVSVYPVHWLDY